MGNTGRLFLLLIEQTALVYMLNVLVCCSNIAKDSFFHYILTINL